MVASCVAIKRCLGDVPCWERGWKLTIGKAALLCGTDGLDWTQ